MTDIEQKALALVNEIEHERGEDELTPRIMRDLIIDEALCRAIEQHEAFKQEVSDALYDYFTDVDGAAGDTLDRFFIPKPDPLVEILEELNWETAEIPFRKALEARGLEIREKGQ